jgi:hypothetical protein
MPVPVPSEAKADAQRAIIGFVKRTTEKSGAPERVEDAGIAAEVASILRGASGAGAA